MSTIIESASRARRVAGLALVPVYLGLIMGLPALAWVRSAALVQSGSPVGAGILLLMSPLIYVATACLLCRVHVKHVVAGRMPVDLGVRPYFHRRLYGLCWTAIYYSWPIYFVILGLPVLKKLVFRAFGYQGPLDFTVYPDTWLRDLSLVHFDSGAYLANKSTIGSNMIFYRNGVKMIEVGPVTIGRNAMIGHLTMIGPSTTVGDGVQIGVGCGIGRRSQIGEGSIIGDVVVLDHGCNVDPQCIIPTRCYVGKGCHVSQAMTLSPGENVLRRSSSAVREGAACTANARGTIAEDGFVAKQRSS